MKLHIPDPDARILVRFHFVMVIAWTIAVYPTLSWWKDSILWVALMSLYANWVGHFAGWDAARAEKNTPSMEDFRRLERKVDKLLNS